MLVPRKVSQTAVTSTLVPFAVLLSSAVLAAERAEALDHSRLLYSSWVSLVLAIPALCLFVYPATRNSDYERLTWTWSYVAYLIHFYYAFGLTYGWSFARTYSSQGAAIATNNFLVTAIWTFDVATSWSVRRSYRWLEIERWVTRLFVFVTFVVSSVFIFHGFVRLLGISMMAAVILCVVARIVQVAGTGGGLIPKVHPMPRR